MLSDEYQLSPDLENEITEVLEEEVRLVHVNEEKSKNIVHDDEEDDDEVSDDRTLSPETRGAIHERRVCELAARMTLAVIGGALAESFAQTLLRYKGKVGQSYDKVILELGAVAGKSQGAKKAGTKKGGEDAIEAGSEMGGES